MRGPAKAANAGNPQRPRGASATRGPYDMNKVPAQRLRGWDCDAGGRWAYDPRTQAHTYFIDEKGRSRRGRCSTTFYHCLVTGNAPEADATAPLPDRIARHEDEGPRHGRRTRRA